MFDFLPFSHQLKDYLVHLRGGRGEVCFGLTKPRWTQTGHNDGTEDPADPNRGDHPSSGEKRRKLLPQLQGQIILGFFFSALILKGIDAEICADTPEVTEVRVFFSVM